MKFLLLLSCIPAICLIACGGGLSSGTIQKSEESFLKFKGNSTGVMIVVDDGIPFPYDKKTDLYKLKPGSHSIKAYRDKQLIVDRTVMLDNQTIFEVDLP